MFYRVAFILVAFPICMLHAQSDNTIVLDTVIITKPKILDYTYGSKVKTVSTKETLNSLSNLINDESAIYFKNYGSGQLSTISFRGTSASHTSVIWNGVPVNSPTLGLTDFSLWPTALLDNVSIFHGGSSANFGSGALGGAIVLSQNKPLFIDSLAASIFIEKGSFGSLNTSASFHKSNRLLQSKTTLYRRMIENDFFIKSENRKQNNASVSQYGIDQQFFLNLKNGNSLSVQGQYLFNERENQPLKSRTTLDSKLKNKDLRIALIHEHGLMAGTVNTTLAFIIHDQVFNDSIKTLSKQYSINSNYEKTFGRSLTIKAGILANKFSTKAENFVESIQETQTDIYLSANYILSKKWRWSLNFRKTYYPLGSSQLAPAIGQEFQVLKNTRNSLVVKSNLSKSYRIPTLNDRYWVPGGNLNLISENGYNGELGIIWKFKNISLDANHFRSWQNDWIIWLPDETNIWSPSNLRKVNVSGIELEGSMFHEMHNSKLLLSFNWNYTKSTNQKGLNINDQTGIDNQLPYVPEHTGNMGLRYSHATWNVNLAVQHTGMRYTTLDNTNFLSVDGFTIANISVQKVFSLNEIEFQTVFRINNLADSNYENFKNYAMPGRNYNIGIKLNFNKTKS